MGMTLRPYQAEAIDSIYQYFAQNTGNPLVAMPTGTGKSHVIGDFVKSVFRWYPNQRIVMATHVKELIEQNLDKLLGSWPSAPAGVYSAGIGRRDLAVPIIFAGIQSVANKAESIGHVDLLLIDEAHLVSPQANTMYQQFINDLKSINPYLKVIGFTATPYRLGLGLLTEGSIFDDICYDLTSPSAFTYLINDGYLVPLIPKRTETTLNVDEVPKRGGEFVEKHLQKAVDQDETTHQALQEIATRGEDRDHWLIFATGVEHTEHIVAMLDSMGIEATCVHSKMTKEQRSEAIQGFKSGRYRAMVNNNVLTTGFDFDAIDLIGVLRPTDSPGLWVQMLGRGTRPLYAPGYDLSTKEGRLASIQAGGKRDCLVLDFGGNTARLGPINDPRIPNPKKKGGKSEAPIKLCEYCGTYNHASLRNCMDCGAEFPRHVRFGSQAATDELIKKDEPVVEDFPVDKVTYTRHQKTGKPDSIRVLYYCGLRRFNEFICLEHSGYPSRKAKEWWAERSSYAPPESTNEALERVGELATPTSIRVWVNRRHPEILHYDYT